MSASQNEPRYRLHEKDPGHCHLSEKYTEYIKIHLADLKSKCDQLTVCINGLVISQSPISVLNGENIQLKKICSLINIKDNSSDSMFNGKCSIQERLDLREDVESHLKDKMDKRDHWDNVAVCLENNYGDDERSTYVKDICGLAEKQDPVCNYQTHRQVEKFVNEQIEHLQCTCKTLLEKEHSDSSSLSTEMIIGMAAGGLLLLCILLGLVCFCWRRRKNKKKKQPNVIYLPSPNGENCPIYQEVFDPAPAPGNPSVRYQSRPLPGYPAEDTEYLEPVQVSGYRSKAPPGVRRLVNNRGYAVESPPEYSETDQTYEDAVLIDPPQNTYIDPITTPNSDNPDGYDTLNHHSSPEEDDNVPDEYQPLEDIDVNKPLGPDPSQRTKKEDRETESEYFELEKVEQT